jgi:hypothetical protein
MEGFNMFYVIDLSKPRKYIQSKYDDVALEYKLNPPKINKPLLAAGTVGIIITLGSTVNASGAIDQAQYNYLLDHYVNDLNYPKELATKLINKLTVTDFQELYTRVQQHQLFMDNGGTEFLEIANNITGKVVEGLKSFIKLYAGM